MAAFGRVQRFALGEAGVFGMPEHEVLHAELRCRFAGFTDRAVVLFVGLEAVAVRIEAESFTEEPAAASRVFPASGRTGLVAEAGELFVAVKAQHEAKLLRLGGTDVEEGCPVASERAFLTVPDRDDKDAVANVLRHTGG